LDVSVSADKHTYYPGDKITYQIDLRNEVKTYLTKFC